MYLSITCENVERKERIAIERQMNSKNDVNAILEEVKFLLGNVLYGIEVQTHWFFTDSMFTIVNDGITESFESIKSGTSFNKTLSLFSSTVDDVIINVKTMPKSKIFVDK